MTELTFEGDGCPSQPPEEVAEKRRKTIDDGGHATSGHVRGKSTLVGHRGALAFTLKSSWEVEPEVERPRDLDCTERRNIQVQRRFANFLGV